MANVREKTKVTNDGAKTQPKKTEPAKPVNTQPYGSNYGGITTPTTKNTSYGSNYAGTPAPTKKVETTSAPKSTPKVTQAKVNTGSYGSNYGGVTTPTTKNTSYGSNYGGGITTKNTINKEKELKNEYDNLKKSYSYTNDDIINSVQYRNANGDTISANDYNSQVNQWRADVQSKYDNIQKINNDYKAGKYGLDENSYNIYQNDFNRALDDYNRETAKKDYFESYNQTEFINFQDQYDNTTKDILNLYTELENARETEDAEKMLDIQLQINNLDKQKTQLEQNIEAQKRVQGGMAIENYEKNGGDLNKLTKELKALDDTTLERSVKQYAINIAKDTANLLDIASVGIDLVSDTQGKVISGVAETLKNYGQISNDEYNDLIDASQTLIDYNVKDDGLASDLRRWTEEQQALVGIGATQQQMMAVNLSAGALTSMTEFWALKSFYRPLKSLNIGTQRYIELTDRGVDPYVALGNATVMSSAHYYLSQIPLEYEGITFSVMANSSITQESMKFLVSRAFNSGVIQAGVTGAEYGIDWINNVVTEYLTGQETGLNYSAGDLFKNMYMDMGQTFASVLGRGTIQSGLNNLRGKEDNRNFGNYVNEFDLKMSIARKALYVSNDNPNKEEILNRYSQTQQGPAEYQSPIPNTYLITSQQEYNQAKADRDLALQIYDQPRTTQLEKDIINQGVSAINNGLQNYENQSTTANKIILQIEQPHIFSLEETRGEMIEFMTPNAEELLVNNNLAVQTDNSINQITEQKLVENNVVAQIEEFTGQSREAREYVFKYGDAVGRLTNNQVVVVANTTLVDEHGNPVAGETRTLPDGRIQISVNPYSKESVKYLTSHESFHAIKGTEAEKRIIEFLDKNASEEQKILSKAYARRYPTEEQMDEYHADLFGRMIEDKDLLAKLKEYDPATFYVTSENVAGISNELYGLQPEIDSILDNIVYGFEEISANNNATLSPSFATENSKLQIESPFARNENGEVNPFEYQLQNIDKMANDQHLILSENGSNLSFMKMKPYETTVSRGTINFLKNGYHKLNDAQIIQLRNEIINPVFAVDSKSNDGKWAKAIFTNVTSNAKQYSDPHYLIAYVREVPYEKINVLVSSYSRKDLQRYLNQLSNQHKIEKQGEFYVNEKTKDYLLAHGLRLPQRADIFGNKRVIQELKNVKLIQKEKSAYAIDRNELPNNNAMVKLDDQGRHLTKEQTKYFENESPLFKDENGNLMTFYHSSPNQFYTFDKDMIGDNTVNDNTGYGFYFTPSLEFSERFKNIDGLNEDEGHTMEVYLKAENPIIHPYMASRMGTFTAEELDNLVREWAIATDAEDGLDAYLEEYGQEVDLDEPGALYDFYINTVVEDGPFGFAEDEREALESKGYDSIILFEGNEEEVAGIEGSTKPVMSYIVFEPNQIKSVDNLKPTNNPDIRYARDFDPNVNNLGEKLKTIADTESEELSELVKQAEGQIVFNGGITDAMKSTLEQKLYNTTLIEEDVHEYTPKEINKFLKENPIRWSTLKGDNNLSLVDFQKEHPGVVFSKQGGKDWDVIAMEFEERFPGTLRADDYVTAREFYDAVADLKKQLGTKVMMPTISRDEFSDEFNKIISEFEKQNKPKQIQEKKVNLEAIERTREGFRKSIKSWIDDYDVIHKKYDTFDSNALDNAIADVYITGEVSDRTRKELMNSIIANDFEGYYTDGKANEYIESFVNELVDYYILETEYNADQRYRDTIAKTANIVNQAKDSMYEEDYERSETARAIDKIAENVRKRDLNAIYDDVQFIIDNLENKVNVLWNRDLREYLDLIANGNKELRQTLYEVIEEPIRQAQAEELAILTIWMRKCETLQKEVGFSMYSKEDNAVGWVVEGKKQDRTLYTLDNLKEDFPKKWKDIMKVVDFYKETVKLFYGEETEELQKIYGDVDYQDEVRTSKLKVDMESARSIMNKREAELKNNPNSTTQAGYSKAKKDFELAQKKYNAKLEENLHHTNNRNETIPHRENYFHHTNEVDAWKNAKAFFESVKNGLSRGNNIPTSLAGKTQYTKPRTTNQSYKWQQSQYNYSSSGFASLQHRIREHANAMAFDKTINYLRSVQSIMGELDNDKKANNYASWFNRYINMLAKKSNDLDRVLRDMSPSGFMNGLKILENRAKQNAVFGNLSSALVQTGNYPIGLALAIKNGGKETIKDVVQGTSYFLMDQKAGGGPKDASTFLNGRFFDIELNDNRLKAKADRFGNSMLSLLDKVTAENLWYTYYAQGQRLNKENPILYADEMTDRAIQGRHPSQMPVSQESEIVKTLIPFQVEVNNQWQVMKDMAKGSVKGDNKGANIGGLIVMALVSAMMNAGFKKILGREPLFDPLTPIIEALGDDELDMMGKEQKATNRIIGEILGAIPGGQYIPSLLGMSEDDAKKFFGESDPSRYGVGNIGLSALAQFLTAEPGDESVKAFEDLLFTYGPSGYGKQMQRFYREGQDFGYLPKFKNGEWRRDPIHYTSTGGVAFVNDPKNFFDFLGGSLFGQYRTKAGQEYIDSNFQKLGKETLTDPNGDAISGSKALQVRKEYQDLGIYDDIVEQINSGQMTPGKAGLTNKVLNMSNEEFEDAYNGMMTKVEGISDKLKDTYNWDNEKATKYQEAVDIEPDYKDGKKVTDSEALKTRKAMEEAGIYNDVLDFIEQNGLSYTDVGLGKRVVNYDEDEFYKAYAKKIGGE